MGDQSGSHVAHGTDGEKQSEASLGEVEDLEGVKDKDGHAHGLAERQAGNRGGEDAQQRVADEPPHP